MKAPAKIGIIFCSLIISLAVFGFIAECSCAPDLFAENAPLNYDITVYASQPRA